VERDVRALGLYRPLVTVGGRVHGAEAVELHLELRERTLHLLV